MTGIIYRRLKVDNGIKIWHYSGVLVHQSEAKEMYQIAWRPDTATLWPERSASSPVPVNINNVEVTSKSNCFDQKTNLQENTFRLVLEDLLIPPKPFMIVTQLIKASQVELGVESQFQALIQQKTRS
jgi:hypothetical protein